jgi:chromosome segregation ATPase
LITQDFNHQRELNNKAKNELTILTKTEKSATKQREQKLKEFEDEVRAAQKAANAAKSVWLAANARKDAIQAEIVSLNQERAACEEQKKISDAAVQRLESEYRLLDDKVCHCLEL